MARPLQIDLGDLQGDILRAYGNDYDCTSYTFVQVDCPPAAAQAWLAGVVDHVTTAQPWTAALPPQRLIGSFPAHPLSPCKWQRRVAFEVSRSVFTCPCFHGVRRRLRLSRFFP